MYWARAWDTPIMRVLHVHADLVLQALQHQLLLPVGELVGSTWACAARLRIGMFRLKPTE